MNILKKIKQLLSNYLSKNVSYYNGEHFYIGEGCFSPLPKAKAICIVARNRCTESKQSYSSISRKELSSLLRLEKNTASRPMHFRVTADLDNDLFEVHKTTFEIDATEADSGWVLIPESYILGTAHPDGVVSAETPSGLLFAYMDNSPTSLYRAGLIQTVEAFKHSIGLPADTKHEKIQMEAYASLLSNIKLNKAFIDLVKAARLNVATQLSPLKLHALYIAPLIMFTLLSGVSVGWQSYQLHQNELQTNIDKEQVFKILSTSNQIDKLNATINEVNEGVLNTALTDSHWEVLRVFIEANVRLNFVRFDGQVLEVDGEVANSSELLGLVTQQAQVQSAQFIGAVNKSGSTDKFNMGIFLK
ncbi:hypothetical protein [Pseudoalteromonas citrea]|uniref:hypothetical protein n=1 Tax=Pseudoalteromonas citrea TaxID=43655 RepID=UPI0012F99275|nr:hypothetical protein [Pseudoalteromonas citrea]